MIIRLPKNGKTYELSNNELEEENNGYEEYEIPSECVREALCEILSQDYGFANTQELSWFIDDNDLEDLLLENYKSDIEEYLLRNTVEV